MKVVCSKNEFALLVRECQCNIADDYCHTCLFAGVCNTSKENPDAIMNYIEDICEISVEG